MKTKVKALIKSTDKYAWLRWVILGLIVATGFVPSMPGPLELLVYILPSIFVLMHGKRYLGSKNIIIFFITTYIVTFTAEYLGVNTGKIFGDYYYNALNNGPLLGGVPILLMLTYFTLAYSSYLLLRIILGWLEVIKGGKIIIISVLGGLLMTLSDLASDPVNSTINKVYIWTHGGLYFGVPFQNFLGWFAETSLLFLIISVIFAYFTNSPKFENPPSRRFLLEPIVLFIAPVLPIIFRPLWTSHNAEIYQAMSLIAIFGLTTISLIGLARLLNYPKTKIK